MRLYGYGGGMIIFLDVYIIFVRVCVCTTINVLKIYEYVCEMRLDDPKYSAVLLENVHLNRYRKTHILL